MFDPKQIPDEVVEAARDALFSDKGMRGAIAAALTAWPGAMGHELVCFDWDGDLEADGLTSSSTPSLILPLAQKENGNE